jgi:hypothetical protein
MLNLTLKFCPENQVKKSVDQNIISSRVVPCQFDQKIGKNYTICHIIGELFFEAKFNFFKDYLELLISENFC